jgi:hypothetical protein
VTSFAHFCEITRGIVAAEGVGSYDPTWLNPESKDIRALGDLPQDVVHREAACAWANELKATTYYLAYADADYVVVEHHDNGQIVATAQIVTTIEYAS